MTQERDHLLSWLEGIFPDTHGPVESLGRSLQESPDRISRAYEELLSGYKGDPSKILTDAAVLDEGSPYSGAVRTTGVPFLSICAHHFLPFFGTVDLAYIPRRRILGLGKIPRLVDCRSRRFQLQEILVKELAEDMITFGDARGVEVSCTAQHLCICYRGPNQTVVRNTTSYTLGEKISGEGR